MTQQEWENASEEERTAEYERCKDMYYMYNTYFKRPNDTVLTKEYFDNVQGFTVLRGRNNREFNPIIADGGDLNNKIEWRKKPENGSAYDGNALNRFTEDWDESYHIPISLLKTNQELYFQLIEQRKQHFEKLHSMFKLTISDKVVGKVWLTSTVDDNDKGFNFKQMWMDEHTDKNK